MSVYLGEVDVDWKSIEEFSQYNRTDWALYYIRMYGGIDGDHHKAWVLDQVARILNGATIKMKKAEWDDGQVEYRVNVGDSKEYQKWVRKVKMGEDGPDTYEYNTGIAP